MALTQTQVSMLYVAIFNRASEGEGNEFWQPQEDMATASVAMLASSAAITYFGASLNSDRAFIEHIYKNTLNKTVDGAGATVADPDGINFWVDLLENGGKTRGEVVDGLVNAAKDPATAGAAQNQFLNRVEVSNYTADTLEKAPLDFKQSLGFGDELPVTDSAATVDAAKANVAALASSEILTAGTDIKSAGSFSAPMVFTPDGSDRILSLQDEDVLTGLGDSATLDVTLGNINADEGTSGTVTPTLNNIQTVNVDWTGNTTTLDLRNADSVENLNIDKITADAAAVDFANISSKVGDMDIANVRDNTSTVDYDYVRGILDGDNDTATIDLNSVLMNSLTITANGATAEGFETVNLSALNGVDLNGTLSIAQMDDLNITGSNFLDIVNLIPTAPVGGAPEYDAFGVIGIANPGSAGLKTINAAEFTGDLKIDISAGLGRNVDPDNSGAPFYGVTTGGTGDDTFYTASAVAGNDTDDNGHNIVDGGAGNNTLITTVGTVANDADIKNIQKLEIRDQDALGVTDMDGFDDSLTSVFMRDEDAGNTTFNLDDVSKAQAESALTLAHSITGSGTQTVDVELKDGTGASDKVVLNVVNDLNTTNTFNYTLNAYGKDTDTKLNGASGDVDKVENITVNDNDTESNVLTLGNVNDHNGTVELTGGVADQSFTVNGSLTAAVVDGSTQASDLRLTVGDTTAPIDTITQNIKLGTGNDILVFGNIDDLDSTDTVSDAGGNDVVKAAFSKDSALTLTDIEGIHLISNENITLGMANTDTDSLVLLADIAADGSNDNSPTTAEPFNITGVTTADVITMTGTKLSTLTFSADLDSDDDNTTANKTIATVAAAAAGGVGTAAGDAAYKVTINDESTIANFNGVTLENNTSDTLKVDINSNLDDVIYGATAYNLGQLTVHGVKTMNVEVSDEDTTAGAANALTTINNIYGKQLETLTVAASEDVNLGVVSGAPLNNSLNVLDASNVGGAVDARIISLGDNGTITLANGDHNVSALGSAGKNITITSGNGTSTLVGSAQSDTIKSGSGFDTIAGDRGNNVIESGAGNDTVTAKDGNDTIDLGTGIDQYTDNLSTNINGTLATNTVAMSGGISNVYIDVTGDGVTAATDVDQNLAVGVGSDLTVSWTGGVINAATAVLDGRLATVANEGVAPIVANVWSFAGDANANLAILTDTAAVATADELRFTGGDGNDVAILTATADSLTFSGGKGNDAAVGGDGSDLITGGTGADQIDLQNTAIADADTDAVIISDGDSIASGWDVVNNFTAAADVAAVIATAATTGTNAGSDYLDLASTTLAIAAANVNGTDSGKIQSHTIDANHLVTFDIDDTNAFAAVQVGTGSGQVSLTDALAYLSTALSGTSSTVAFTYNTDVDGNTTGNGNVADNTFVFQDGANDTVVELVGVVADGVGAVGVADFVASTIEIA